MPIVSCPACQSQLRAPDEVVGQDVRCPKCAKVFIVPAASAAPATSAVAPVSPPPMQHVPPLPSGYPQPPGYPPSPYSPPGYPPQPNAYQPPPFPPQSGVYPPPPYPPQSGYPTPGYGPPGYAPQGGYAPGPGYPPQNFGGNGNVTQTSYNPDTFHQLYLTGIILFLVAVVLLVIGLGCIAIGLMNPRDQRTASAFLGIGLYFLVPGYPCAMAGGILFLVFLYKAWNQIQDGYATATPGQAVGFLFIPFFNFYWIFVAYRGLAVDLNRYLQRNRISAAPVPEGLAVAMCITTLCMLIPCAPVMLLVLIANTVLFFLVMTSFKNASVAIATWKRGSTH